ncbi:tRNA pseudouridine(55) synthase TruB [Yunchengibacter salinarum]|uniref:tRNA pseudouridine(55) synthase TruB n=1 Tax=Yunchengibacter salinarum TaxID=3133399 RepID=UPI0035B5E097
MGRTRKGEKIDGWLVLDKPLGMTSAQAVAAVKRRLRPQKIGHAGTLDPLATGCLPLGLGEATKTMPFIVSSEKSYDFTVRWGAETNTDDLEGEVTVSGGPVPAQAAITDALAHFTGVIAQVPPAYSAIKIDGERAYKKARAGEAVTLSARPVRVDALTLARHDAAAGESAFHVRCGKGTYVRSLARDLARHLGTFGHVTALRRLAVGPFAGDHMISFEKLDALGHSARAQEAVLPVETALDDIPVCAVTGAEAARLKNGQALVAPDSLRLPEARNGAEPVRVAVTSEDRLVALAQRQGAVLKPVRIFHL